MFKIVVAFLLDLLLFLVHYLRDCTGFECSATNPIFPISPVIFITRNSITRWFLGTHLPRYRRNDCTLNTIRKRGDRLLYALKAFGSLPAPNLITALRVKEVYVVTDVLRTLRVGLVHLIAPKDGNSCFTSKVKQSLYTLGGRGV
jgi:hypothetical protein